MWFIYCESCHKILYQPTEDNSTTWSVGMTAAKDHSCSFPTHAVLYIDLRKPLLN